MMREAMGASQQQSVRDSKRVGMRAQCGDGNCAASQLHEREGAGKDQWVSDAPVKINVIEHAGRAAPGVVALRRGELRVSIGRTMPAFSDEHTLRTIERDLFDQYVGIDAGSQIRRR